MYRVTQVYRKYSNYPEYLENNLPIGSGVIKAACKTLIKQRLCYSGMKWTERGAGIILSLRYLVSTKDRWIQFWDKLERHQVAITPIFSIHFFKIF